MLLVPLPSYPACHIAMCHKIILPCASKLQSSNLPNCCCGLVGPHVWSEHIVVATNSALRRKPLYIREGFKFFFWKKYGLLPNRGAGGSARVVKKQNCFFEKSIFQRVSRIILGPPKHVLHLVLIDISTAINIALKLACLGKFMAL